MCNPNVVNTVFLVTSSLSKTAMGTEKEDFKYKYNSLIQNAKQNEQEAISERQEGIEEARNRKLKTILEMGKEKTVFASGNLSLNSQTVLNILENNKLNGELDALNVINKSEKRADNMMLRANNYYENAALTSFKYKSNSKINLGNIIGSIKP